MGTGSRSNRALIVVLLAAAMTSACGDGNAPTKLAFARDVIGKALRGEDFAATISRAGKEYGAAFAASLERRARATAEIYDVTSDPAVRRGGCAALDLVEKNGGPEGLTEEEIADFVRGQLGGQYAGAQQLAEAVDQLTNFDLGLATTVACINP